MDSTTRCMRRLHGHPLGAAVEAVDGLGRMYSATVFAAAVDGTGRIPDEAEIGRMLGLIAWWYDEREGWRNVRVVPCAPMTADDVDPTPAPTSPTPPST